MPKEDFYKAFLCIVRCNPRFPLAVSFKKNLADLETGNYQLGPECFTVGMGGDADQGASRSPGAGFSVPTCIFFSLTLG